MYQIIQTAYTILTLLLDFIKQSFTSKRPSHSTRIYVDFDLFFENEIEECHSVSLKTILTKLRNYRYVDSDVDSNDPFG